MMNLFAEFEDNRSRRNRFTPVCKIAAVACKDVCLHIKLKPLCDYQAAIPVLLAINTRVFRCLKIKRWLNNICFK